jgi:hypothetical protein
MESINSPSQNEAVEKINKCNKKGCDKDSKLRCPDCKKLRIKDESYFCGKECFKSYWNEHKQLHVECKYDIIIY